LSRLKTVIRDQGLTEDLKKTVLILAPDGVSIRNFVLSNVARRLDQVAQAALWYSLPKFLEVEIEKLPLSEKRRDVLGSRRESLAPRILRQSKLFAQLFYFRERGSGYFLSSLGRTRSFRRALPTDLSKIIGWIAARTGKLSSLEVLHRQFIRNSGLDLERSALEELKPSILLCTHQRASSAIATMVAAQTLGIPTVNFIYSWDNLPKGRMAVPADYFFVWSDHMKAEMARYYPEVSSDRVFVTGTPQFEHYFNQELVWSEEEFRRKLGLESGRKIVVFSGDDITTSPLDPFYLADVAESIRLIPQGDRPHLVFRRCPVDVSGRYDWVIEKYPEIVVSEPLWRRPAENDSWDSIVPTKDDVELLCNLVRHSDLVINIGSTMALDFAIFDKPAIFIRYDQPEGVGETRREIEEVYSLPHFRVFDNVEPVVWARSKEDLPRLISKALSSPYEVAKDRKKLLEKIAAHPLEKASDRIVSALLEIAEKHSPGISVQ
jgi:hypothetical protein